MPMKHVILRRIISKGRGAAMGSGTAMAAEATSEATVTVETENLSPTRAAELASSAEVLCLAPVVPMKLIAPVAMNEVADPLAGNVTWGVKAVGADQSPFTGDDVTVALLDTGIDSTHPGFAGVQLTRKNFTSEGADDTHGHGTHCAGTIFGRAVGGTRIGVAPGVKKALIGKVLGANGGGSDTILFAIEWALQNGAQVISMSLGIDFPGLVRDLVQQGMPTALATSKALEGYRANVLLFERLAALIRARGSFMQGCLLIAAAGNESQRDQSADFKVAVSPPAVAEGIVSVAALGQSPNGFVVAPFSNIGARLSGPGVGIQSAKLGGGLTSMSGTSMATPHVAGVAALWIQKLQLANQARGTAVTDKLVGSATMSGLKVDSDAGDVGAGIVRAPIS